MDDLPIWVMLLMIVMFVLAPLFLLLAGVSIIRKTIKFNKGAVRVQETARFSMLCNATARENSPNLKTPAITANAIVKSLDWAKAPLCELFLAFLVLSAAKSR